MENQHIYIKLSIKEYFQIEQVRGFQYTFLPTNIFNYLGLSGPLGTMSATHLTSEKTLTFGDSARFIVKNMEYGLA